MVRGSELRTREWTWEAYLEWEARQEIKHELVDGQVRAMTGGTVAATTSSRTISARSCGPGCGAGRAGLRGPT